jgi:hypothetical protein
MIAQIKRDIENTYSEQKITQTQFNLFNKKISDEDKGDERFTKGG